ATGIVRVRGLVHPFGLAPPAFDATTVDDIATDTIGASFHGDWRAVGGTATPFNDIGDARIEVNLVQARQVLSLLGVPNAALSASNRVVLLPSGDVVGVYVVTVRGSLELRVFRDFAALTAALNDQLTSGH